MTQSATTEIASDGATAKPFSIYGPVVYIDCSVSTGEERILTDGIGGDDGETGVVEAVLAGTYVALVSFDTDFHYGGSSGDVTVYDVNTGRGVPRLGGEHTQCDGYSCETRMDGLVMNAQGFTAVHVWTSVPEVAEEIQVSDGPGARTVDTATETSLVSSVLANLTLSGDIVTWTHAGTPESATLQ